MSRKPVTFVLALLVVCLTSMNLRAGIASVAPVLGEIQDFFGVGSTAAGMLTALPGFAFALMGWGAVPVARKLGLSVTLVIGGLSLLLGLALRPWTGHFGVFLGLTFFVASGIAVANVILPAWIKAHTHPRRLVPVMAAYTTMLGISTTLGPLSIAVFPQWRASLAVWAIPVVAQLAVWAVALPRTLGDVPREPEEEQGTRVSIFKSPTAVAMLFFFGLQSAMAYVQMGWLPKMYIDAGGSQSLGSWALALTGAINIVGGAFMPWLIARLDNLTPVPVVLALCAGAGWAGMLWAPTTLPMLWAGLLGIGNMCFPLALALLTARTRTAVMTARLSGFVQPGGYVLAGIIPLLIGVANSWSGGWTVSLVMLIGLCVTMLLVGVGAARNVYIEDELAERGSAS